MKSSMMAMSVMIGFFLLTGCGSGKSSAKPDAKDVIVVLETNQGKIELVLFPDKAPKACENFLGLVKKGFYDGLIFHRVIKGFMIQGGDPNGNGTGGQSLWGQPFEDEFSPDLSFSKMGILAMANRGPATNTSQFFITTGQTPWLNGKHTIFGEIVSGYDVLMKIEDVAKGPGDRPLEPQTIIKATVREE